MKALFESKPIKASFISCISILLIYPFIKSLFEFTGTEALYLDGMLRIFFMIPAAILLGIIVNKNGFKYAFSIRSSKEALLASSALLLYIFATGLHFFNISGTNIAFKPYILPTIVFNSLSAIYEEVLCRGLLMTAMLIKFGGTAKGRLAVALIGSIIFGLGHINNGLSALLLTTIVGMGFASTYIYSGNVIVPMLVHAFWNHFVMLSGGLIAEMRSQAFLKAVQAVQHAVLFFIIPAFAIFMCIKAKPFYQKIWP